jgi:hypothetical protein
VNVGLVACEWRIGDVGFDEVRIVERIDREGTRRFAVVEHGWVLSRAGEWEYEPLPSSRDGDFMARCRFDDFEDAYRTAVRAMKARPSPLSPTQQGAA